MIVLLQYRRTRYFVHQGSAALHKLFMTQLLRCALSKIIKSLLSTINTTATPWAELLRHKRYTHVCSLQQLLAEITLVTNVFRRILERKTQDTSNVMLGSTPLPYLIPGIYVAAGFSTFCLLLTASSRSTAAVAAQVAFLPLPDCCTT